MSTEPALFLRTLGRDAHTIGVSLHSGRVVEACLRPRRQRGIVFVRTDLPGTSEISASLRCVTRTVHATTLAEGEAAVSTTEHLMAALWAMNITNCRIELDGPEVPILDGSARDWCQLIDDAGIVDVEGTVEAEGASAAAAGLAETCHRPRYTLREPVWVSDGKGSVLGLPHHELRLTVAVDYEVDYMAPQMVDLTVTSHAFRAELAPARTFTLGEWIEPLRAQGLIRGGSTENAVVLWRDAPSAPWRLENELARHKALDVVGDVALLFGANGGRLQAHLIAIRAGHGLHRQWMEECTQRGALTLIPA